jgi:hypothetical protein
MSLPNAEDLTKRIYKRHAFLILHYQNCREADESDYIVDQNIDFIQHDTVSLIAVRV